MKYSYAAQQKRATRRFERLHCFMPYHDRDDNPEGYPQIVNFIPLPNASTMRLRRLYLNSMSSRSLHVAETWGSPKPLMSCWVIFRGPDLIASQAFLVGQLQNHGGAGIIPRFLKFGKIPYLSSFSLPGFPPLKLLHLAQLPFCSVLEPFPC
jgi:hypothetical protein